MGITPFSELCVEYDAALLELERATERLRAIREVTGVEPAALKAAEGVYGRARLCWLRAEWRLRVGGSAEPGCAPTETAVSGVDAAVAHPARPDPQRRCIAPANGEGGEAGRVD
ncbi:MAG TPA: hypothetical protein VGN31_00455 [Paraburkholderia sp.]|jgi:hypothetical protein